MIYKANDVIYFIIIVIMVAPGDIRTRTRKLEFEYRSSLEPKPSESTKQTKIPKPNTQLKRNYNILFIGFSIIFKNVNVLGFLGTFISPWGSSRIRICMGSGMIIIE